MFPYRRKKVEFNPEHCMIEDVYGEDVDLWKMLTWTRKYLSGIGEPAESDITDEMFDTFLAIKWFYDDFYGYDCKTYGPVPEPVINAVDALEQQTLFGSADSWVRAITKLKDLCEQIFKHRRERGSSTKYMCRKTTN